MAVHTRETKMRTMMKEFASATALISFMAMVALWADVLGRAG